MTTTVRIRADVERLAHYKKLAAMMGLSFNTWVNFVLHDWVLEKGSKHGVVIVPPPRRLSPAQQQKADMAALKARNIALAHKGQQPSQLAMTPEEIEQDSINASRELRRRMVRHMKRNPSDDPFEAVYPLCELDMDKMPPLWHYLVQDVLDNADRWREWEAEFPASRLA